MAGHATRTHWCRVLAFRGFQLVAAFALHLGVRAIQWIFGTPGMVKLPGSPGAGVVAALAALAKPELVLVFFFMARIAVARRVFEQGVFVAVLAQHSTVAPRQRKTAQIVVKLVDCPRTVAVTLFALFALLTFVLVILFVAAVAVKRRTAIAFEVFVAAAALEFCVRMGVAKLKLRQVMVKAARSRLPVALAVAIGAGLALRALVLVFLFVAAVAVFGRFLEHRAFVAVLAIGLQVLAQQRKAGLVVVEPGWLFPAALAMAACAVTAQ